MHLGRVGSSTPCAGCSAGNLQTRHEHLMHQDQSDLVLL